MTLAGREIFSRTAEAEGRHVATLRCVDTGEETVVECLIGAERTEHTGAYVFPDEQDARRFVEETTLALEFLGCEVL